VPVEAGLGDLDARWIVALRAGALLEGGRAAIMTPASRRYVIDLARDMGLGAFDANLIIAIAQESARRGEALTTPAARQRVSMVAPARHAPGPEGAWVVYAVGLVCAAVALGLLYARVFGVA
jgi:hypothetical protein